MEDDIETFDLTPSETHDPAEHHGLSPQGTDDATFPGLALLARFTATSATTPGPAPSDPPSVGVDEVSSEDPRPTVDHNMDADIDSEAEKWSEFSHPGYEFHLQGLLEKARSRKRELKTLRAEKTRYLEHNKRLEAEIKQLKAPKLRHNEVTWPSLFNGKVSPGWMTIYATACKEGNASPRLDKIHPDLRLRKPTTEELQNDLLQRDMAPVQTVPEIPERPKTVKLPADIQFQILKHFLHFKGRVVHAISRLDPNHADDSAPLNRDGKPSFYHRLHVGRTPVSIKFAPDPNVFLAPLLVCKRWHFWGSHIFYGENTFAFSSLGE
ncbi:hypothetical protein HDV57DRAFT_226501 [Trichoderma longibrachiatum]